MIQTGQIYYVLLQYDGRQVPQVLIEGGHYLRIGSGISLFNLPVALHTHVQDISHLTLGHFVCHTDLVPDGPLGGMRKYLIPEKFDLPGKKRCRTPCYLRGFHALLYGPDNELEQLCSLLAAALFHQFVQYRSEAAAP